MDIKKTKFKDWVNPKKWFAVFRSVKNQRVVPPMHEMEQYVYRSVVCKPCVENGNCLFCGCTTLPKMLDPKGMCDNAETGFMWGPIMEKEKWENYKKKSKQELQLIFEEEPKLQLENFDVPKLDIRTWKIPDKESK